MALTLSANPEVGKSDALFLKTVQEAQYWGFESLEEAEQL